MLRKLEHLFGTTKLLTDKLNTGDTHLLNTITAEITAKVKNVFKGRSCLNVTVSTTLSLLSEATRNRTPTEEEDLLVHSDTVRCNVSLLHIQIYDDTPKN